MWVVNDRCATAAARWESALSTLAGLLSLPLEVRFGLKELLLGLNTSAEKNGPHQRAAISLPGNCQVLIGDDHLPISSNTRSACGESATFSSIIS